MFKNRTMAGKMLAAKLQTLKLTGKPIVLAIPRGGVVVGYEIAKALKAPLDLLIPRKLPAPLNPEVAVGAVAQDGTTYFNEKLLTYLHLSPESLQEEIDKEKREITRRMEKFRGSKEFPDLKGKSVIVVDDGIATGFTMLAGIRFIAKQQPEEIIVAVPVAPEDEVQRLGREVTQIITLAIPKDFYAVGQFYEDFTQTGDEEVTALLAKARAEETVYV
ncbi:phosphoribosyltransferase [Zhaonella formicivorans]|uniref:phosphoribosyltransferase n=1 Tax=Zhaonella formicivorans TaxID=2528593 RepID=UPI0010DCA53D|nr:phosphoribosyltransferase [Zhaonella formicivorans]